MEREKLIQNLTELGLSKKGEYNTNKERISQLQIELTKFQTLQNTFPELESRARKLSTQIQDYTTRINNHQEQVTKWQQVQYPAWEAIQKSLAAEDFLPEVRQELTQIENEIRNLGYDIDRHNQLRRRENELRPISEEMQKLAQARATLAPLEREIGDIQKQIQSMDEVILALEQEYQIALISLEQAKAQAPDLEQAEREWRILEEQANNIRLELGVAQQKVNVLHDLKKRYQLLEEERDQKNRRIGWYKQLERAFGKDGIPAILIEQALPQIEEHANQILARLSNGSMTLRFVTQTEYKDKHRDDLKETLDILISDNNGIRDYELYSGGEAFRINFAIRLAISEVLAQRAGARLQTLVIDEGFGSQDAMGRQRLIEAINLVQDKFA
ncbi:MAG: SbcC/MukB-like Walker B domain-containing protein, partial [Anaerolineales bacterium]